MQGLWRPQCGLAAFSHDSRPSRQLSRRECRPRRSPAAARRCCRWPHTRRLLCRTPRRTSLNPPGRLQRQMPPRKIVVSVVGAWTGENALGVGLGDEGAAGLHRLLASVARGIFAQAGDSAPAATSAGPQNKIRLEWTPERRTPAPSSVGRICGSNEIGELCIASVCQSTKQPCAYLDRVSPSRPRWTRWWTQFAVSARSVIATRSAARSVNANLS